MKHLHQAVLGFLLVFAVLPGVALAQVRPGATGPSSTQPGQLQQYLQLNEGRPEVGGEPLITVPDEGKKKLSGGVTFKLKNIEFENLTAFKKDDLLPLYKGYIGKDITLGTLTEIANKITVRYRNAGYILSRAVVPPQKIENGIAKIRIVEGYVNKVLIEGKFAEASLIKKYADKIRNAHPLDAKTLERYLLLMEDLPAVTAHAVIRPSTDTPGASDVVVTLDEKKVDGSVTLNNRGTRYLGPVQGGLTANVNNLFCNFYRTQFHGVETAELNELRYGQISHDEQLDSEGTKLTISASDTLTHPAYTLRDLDLEGRDTLLSAIVTHPFIRSRQSNLYGNIEFDVHDSGVDEAGGASAGTLYEDRLRVLRGGGAYDFVDMFSAVNKIEATVSQGFSWGTASSTDPVSRTDGSTDFTKASGQISRLQPIKGPFDLYVAASGQWSANTLLIGEQFGIGGENFGSAYDPSEIIGDSGVDARAEFRYTRTGDFAIIPNYQFYAFYDVGKVWDRDSGAGTPPSASLADTGVGVRFNAEMPLSGSLEFAAPLTRPVAADTESATEVGDGYHPRVFFSLEYRF